MLTKVCALSIIWLKTEQAVPENKCLASQTPWQGLRGQDGVTVEKPSYLTQLNQTELTVRTHTHALFHEQIAPLLTGRGWT